MTAPEDLESASRPLDKAALMIASGEVEPARALLRDLLENEPQNVQAWLLLAACTDSPGTQRYIYERVLEVNPANRQAQAALSPPEKNGISLSRRATKVLVGVLVLGGLAALAALFGGPAYRAVSSMNPSSPQNVVKLALREGGGLKEAFTVDATYDEQLAWELWGPCDFEESACQFTFSEPIVRQSLNPNTVAVSLSYSVNYVRAKKRPPLLDGQPNLNAPWDDWVATGEYEPRQGDGLVYAVVEKLNGRWQVSCIEKNDEGGTLPDMCRD